MWMLSPNEFIRDISFDPAYRGFLVPSSGGERKSCDGKALIGAHGHDRRMKV